jgi:hypothetical protein
VSTRWLSDAAAARRREALLGRSLWYSSAHTVMRVSFAMLADELDGVCVKCSRAGREHEAEDDSHA